MALHKERDEYKVLGYLFIALALPLYINAGSADEITAAVGVAMYGIIFSQSIRTRVGVALMLGSWIVPMAILYIVSESAGDSFFRVFFPLCVIAAVVYEQSRLNAAKVS